MNWNLMGANVTLGVWILVVFIQPVGLGIVHLLLAAAVALFIRWWALKYAALPS